MCANAGSPGDILINGVACAIHVVTCAIQTEIRSAVVLRPNVIQTAGALAAPRAPVAAALVLRAARRRSPDSGRIGSGRFSAADSSFDGGAGDRPTLTADV